MADPGCYGHFTAFFVGGYVRALWCPFCNLPSVWSCMTTITPKTNPMFVLSRGWWSQCEECSRHRFVRSDEAMLPSDREGC